MPNDKDAASSSPADAPLANKGDTAGPEAGRASPGQEPAPTVFGMPMQVFVRGGTTSWAHDKMMAQQRADDEQRRQESDADRALAKNPGENATAHMYESAFGTPQQHPVVLLTVVGSGGDVKLDKSKPVQVLADIFVGDNPEDPRDLALNMCCPYCWSRGTPLGRCQFKVRQSNRFWALDSKGAGELLAFNGQVYQGAGTVMDSERIKCPQCSWTFRINKNRIYEEVSG